MKSSAEEKHTELWEKLQERLYLFNKKTTQEFFQEYAKFPKFSYLILAITDYQQQHILVRAWRWFWNIGNIKIYHRLAAISFYLYVKNVSYKDPDNTIDAFQTIAKQYHLWNLASWFSYLPSSWKKTIDAIGLNEKKDEAPPIHSESYLLLCEILSVNPDVPNSLNHLKINFTRCKDNWEEKCKTEKTTESSQRNWERIEKLSAEIFSIPQENWQLYWNQFKALLTQQQKRQISQDAQLIRNNLSTIFKLKEKNFLSKDDCLDIYYQTICELGLNPNQPYLLSDIKNYITIWKKFILNPEENLLPDKDLQILQEGADEVAALEEYYQQLTKDFSDSRPPFFELLSRRYCVNCSKDSAIVFKHNLLPLRELNQRYNPILINEKKPESNYPIITIEKNDEDLGDLQYKILFKNIDEIKAKEIKFQTQQVLFGESNVHILYDLTFLLGCLGILKVLSNKEDLFWESFFQAYSKKALQPDLYQNQTLILLFRTATEKYFYVFNEQSMNKSPYYTMKYYKDLFQKKELYFYYNDEAQNRSFAYNAQAEMFTFAHNFEQEFNMPVPSLLHPMDPNTDLLEQYNIIGTNLRILELASDELNKKRFEERATFKNQYNEEHDRRLYYLKCRRSKIIQLKTYVFEPIEIHFKNPSTINIHVGLDIYFIFRALRNTTSLCPLFLHALKILQDQRNISQNKQMVFKRITKDERTYYFVFNILNIKQLIHYKKCQKGFLQMQYNASRPIEITPYNFSILFNTRFKQKLITNLEAKLINPAENIFQILVV